MLDMKQTPACYLFEFTAWVLLKCFDMSVLLGSHGDSDVMLQQDESSVLGHFCANHHLKNHGNPNR